MSSERRKREVGVLDFSKLETRIERVLREKDIPSFALAIVQGEDVTYARGFGTTSVEEGGIPVTPGTLFCIGSVSKPLTGTAIVRLVERGLLELDRPVVEYLPALTFSLPGAADGVTLRRLLSHTSGLPSAYTDNGPRDLGALGRYVREEIPKRRFIAPPATLFSYSNAGLDLAGHVAEVVTGMYFPDLMRELVFAPLAMERATYDRAVAMTYPVALPHVRDADGRLRVRHRIDDNVSGNPAGFAMASALDLANFATAHLNQGRFRGEPFLSPASVAAMHRPYAQMYLASGMTYGLTFDTEFYRGRRWVGHFGQLPPYSSVISLFPEERVAVVALWQGAEEPGVLGHLYDTLFGPPTEEPPLRPVAPDRARWPGFVGTYLSWEEAGLATVRVEGDRLVLERRGIVTPLEAYRPDFYADPSGHLSVGFVPVADGPTQYILVDGIAHERVEYDAAFVPEPAVLADYAGTYRTSDGELFAVRVEANRLSIVLSRESGERGVHVTALDDRRFATDIGLMTFRSAPGAPPALIYRDVQVAARLPDPSLPEVVPVSERR
jgi:CubicO group peptidase (beta-lactamase class C family)